MNNSTRGLDEQWSSVFDFVQKGFCKISPNTKVLLSIPQNIKYEEQYTPDDTEKFYRQCENWVDMDVYLQNDSGVFKTQTSLGTTFPVCMTFMEMPWWWSWRTDFFQRELLIPGTFIMQPIILDEEYNLIRWNYTLDDIQADLTILLDHPKRTDVMIEIQDIPLVVNVRNLPECQPNIRLKK